MNAEMPAPVAPEATPAELVFVGGTGRSGTHILGRLLGNHPRFADVPIEARFHCNKRGLGDLLEGRVSLGGFLAKLREFWWHRVRVDDQPRGLYNLMRRARFDAAADRFEAGYHDDPVAACRRLFDDLLGGVAESEGKPGLVEMSSHNVKEAQTLRRLFAEARFVHTVRDGRDSASSVTTKTWGPRSHHRRRSTGGPTACGRSMPGFAARRTAPSSPLGRTACTRSCSTTSSPATASRAYARLLAFLGVEDDAAIRGFFDAEMSAGGANRGRWARASARSAGRACGASTSARSRRSRTRETTSRRRCRRLRAPRMTAADGPRGERERILFVSSNGTGLGHLTRSMAIARRLGGRCEPLFFTLSGAAPVVREQGFPVEYAASYATPGAGSDWRWSRRLRGRLRAAFAERRARASSSSTAPIPTRR